MHAVTAGHTPIVEALLHAGASVNQPWNDSMTA
jgi:ankyrin repeat protein